MNRPTSILLIAYNRPEKVSAVLESLKNCEELSRTKLYVSIDGPKEKRLTDVLMQSKIEDLVRAFEPKVSSLEIFRSSINQGLADNIVSSINRVFEQEEKLIILEDDILINSPYFLRFMNEGLDKFVNTNVYQISAYNYPVDANSFTKDIFSLRVMSCWGWATWRDKWAVYSNDIDKHFDFWSATKKRRNEFDIKGHAHFFSQLERNKKGKMYTWAVRWYASWMKAGGQCVYPRLSLVKNIGMDGTGTFTGDNQKYQGEFDTKSNWSWEINHTENSIMLTEVDRFFKTKANIKSKINLKGILYLPVKLLKKKASAYIESTVNRTNNKAQIHNATIYKPSRIANKVELNDVVLGKYSYISKNSIISHCHIGSFCSVGPNCLIGWGIHPLNLVSTSPLFYSNIGQTGKVLRKDTVFKEREVIYIGNDVFIGANVTILDGVKIGDGAVIGAGALVNKDIEPYAIVGGVPAKLIGYRHPKEVIDKLLDIKFWEKDEAWIQDNIDLFLDVEKFISLTDKPITNTF